MTRMEEYNALLQELEETPDRLNFTVARAKARTRRQRVRKWVGAPLISLSAACYAFVLLVNFSTSFAMACAKVPFFKELAEAVSFHPSLYAAVENEWVQPIGQTDTDNGYTMTVEYLIVDQKQLNVFYTLQGGEEVDPEDAYMIRPDFLDARGENVTAAVVTRASYVNGELYHATADFLTEDTMPSEIRMECKLERHWDDSESKDVKETVASFAFDLSFDPKFTAQAKVVKVNRWLELDGQKIRLNTVEIYPTHIRIDLEDHPDNTAWLRDLELYVENEKGERFGGVTNGISGSGDPDSPFQSGYRLESSFFADSEHLTLHISGAQWLEKDRRWTQVNLTTQETGYLPDRIELHQIRRDEDNLIVVFRDLDPEENFQGHPLFSSWRAPDGTEGYLDGFGYGSREDGSTELYNHVNHYTWDTIELELNYNLTTKYAEPVAIDLF